MSGLFSAGCLRVEEAQHYLMQIWLRLDQFLVFPQRFLPFPLPDFYGLDKLPLIVCLSLVIWIIIRWVPLPSFLKKDGFLSVSAVILLVAIWGPLILLGQRADIAGEAFWCLSDDAMISMRYGRNLAEGYGPVWNPGERVEGYSNFLWTLYMAFLHLWSIPGSKIMLIVLLTNLTLTAATIPVLIRIVRLLGGGSRAAVLVAAGTLLGKIPLGIAVMGLETCLLTFLFCLCLYLILRDHKAERVRPSTYFWIALIPLIRADSAVLAVLLYALSLFLNREKKTVLYYSALSLALPLAHEIFRILYYGDILPNTAYLKVMNWHSRYESGWEYVSGFFFLHLLMVLTALAGALFSRNRTQVLLMGICLLYAAYLISIGGDWFRNFRFFLPIFPLVLILAFRGVDYLTSRDSLRIGLSLLCLMTIPLLLPGYKRVVHELNAYKRFDIYNIQMGLLIKKNTPPSVRVADVAAGSVFYFSERYGVDLLGKSDRYIARLPVVPEATKAGHNKFDYTYSLGRLKPDLVIAGFNWPVDPAEMAARTSGDEAFIGRLYFNPIFQRHFLPNPVKAKTGRAIFVADWSDQVDFREKWKPLK